jgi:hypothetical protein
MESGRGRIEARPFGPAFTIRIAGFDKGSLIAAPRRAIARSAGLVFSFRTKEI